MNSIIVQPAANSILAAYRPIEFLLLVDPAPSPVNFCDIYFNNVYYKTISRTYAESLNTFRFDIQDACQEYLKKFKYAVGGYVIGDRPVLSVYCKFRSTYIDSNGLIASTFTAPVQGTLDTAPLSGTGDISNVFYVLNSALQQDDNWNFKDHLNSYKQGIWNADVFPLSHSKKFKIGNNDSAYFPVVNLSAKVPGCLDLNYKDKTTGAWIHVAGCVACGIAITDLSSEWNAAEEGYNLSINIVGVPLNFQIQVSVDGGLTWNVSIAAVLDPGSTTGFYSIDEEPDPINHMVRVRACCDALCVLTNDWTVYNFTDGICFDVAITGGTPIPDAQVGTPYNHVVNISGSAPFNLTGVTKPAWMAITIVGLTVELTGTPVATGTDIPVEFTVENCAAGTASVSEEIDITEDDGYTITYTNNIGAQNIELRIGNNMTYPTHTIYNGLYSSDPLTGSDVELPAVDAIVSLTLPGNTIMNAHCNGVPGLIAGSSASWSHIDGPLVILVLTF